MTYTQEQVSTIVQSYTDEILRLLNLKTELKLQIIALRKDNIDKINKLDELQKETVKN